MKKKSKIKNIVLMMILLIQMLVIGILIGSSKNVRIFNEAQAATSGIENSSNWTSVNWGTEYAYGRQFIVFTNSAGGIYVIQKTW